MSAAGRDGGPAGAATDDRQLHDRQLLDRLRAGDDRAYEILVRRETPAMLAAARRLLRDDAAAQDCVQEAFVSAFRGLDGFELRASIGAWLRRITVNAALMRLRKGRRLAEAPIDDLLPSFNAAGFRPEPLWRVEELPDEEIERKRIRARVREKIDELPDGYRIVLMLRDIEEMSTQETAQAMGIQEGAVKVRLHRARGALKKLLEPMWEQV